MLNHIRWPAAAALFVLAAQGIAQTSKGTIAGEVRDQSSAVVAHATVAVVNQDTQETRQTATDSEGSFRVEAINPGVYSIHVDAPGFRSFDIKDVIVRASVITTYNPIITVGSVKQTVNVVANSNAVNTDNGHLSASIGSQELEMLPIFSLNPVELVATLPGTQYVNDLSTDAEGTYGQYYHVEVNGARPRANNYMLDGQDINDVGLGGQAFAPQIPDMFQSVVVLTNSSSAEYGRAGGAVINLISKAGTNQFHGTAFELYSGSGLNAVDGITRVGSTSRANKGRYDEHQFGFTAGGPLWRNKIFAFGGTQFSRYYGNQTSGLVELPDANGYATLTAIGGPQVALLQTLLSAGSYLTQYQYKASLGVVETINVGRPTIGNASVCPAGGCIVTTGYFQRPPVPLQNPDTQWLYRIDFIPRERDTFTFRYLHDRNNATPDIELNTSGLPGFDGQVGGPSELASGNWTHVFTPHLLNELRASETRIHFLFTPTPEALANPASKIYNVNFSDVGIPVLGLSQNIPQGTGEDGYQFQDTVGWVIGRQSFRIGADIGRILETDIVAQEAIGWLNFAAGGGPSGMGNFLNNHLGASGYATKTFGPTRIDPHTWRSAGFIQDDVKVSPELTLNLGLRYDYLTDPGNSLPYPAVDVENPFAYPINTVFKIHTDTRNFGPRFGFAYAPNRAGWLSAGTTAVHGGFGIFYDTSFSNLATNSAQTSPNAPTGTLISTQGAGLGNATGLLATITPDLTPQDTVLSVDRNLVNPRTYQWNLGVERALPLQLKLAVNYVASRGRALYANQQYNYFDADTGLRLDPNRGDIDARANDAASQYDSLQVDVVRQFSHGLFFRGAYTYGKSLDDGSEVFDLFSSPTSYPANLAPGGRAQDWGPSAFDYRHYFSVAYSWSPAGFHAANHAANLLLGGFTRNFTISGITQLQSGPPSTFNIDGIDTNQDGDNVNDRPLVGNPHSPLNTAGVDGIYVGADPGTYYDVGQVNSTGNLVVVNPQQVHWLIPFGGAEITPLEIGRDSFTNPGSTVWNVAAQKDIPAPWTRLEGASFQLRAEAQDVGNHNDVGILNTNVLTIGSGDTYLNPGNSRVASGRQVRFWAKFSF